MANIDILHAYKILILLLQIDVKWVEFSLKVILSTKRHNADSNATPTSKHCFSLTLVYKILNLNKNEKDRIIHLKPINRLIPTSVNKFQFLQVIRQHHISFFFPNLIYGTLYNGVRHLNPMGIY